MVRPKSSRKVEHHPETVYFKPQGIPLRKLEEECITVDELESLRLADVEGLYHEQAAQRMGVSRATFGRIVQAARRKIATALVVGKAIRVHGGSVEFIEDAETMHETTEQPATQIAFQPQSAASHAQPSIQQTMQKNDPGDSSGYY